MVTMRPLFRRTALSAGALLAALPLLAPTVSATVPHDTGQIVVGDPWLGPARPLRVDVNTSCALVDGVTATSALQVSTRDPAWEGHLHATGGLSSALPITRTTAEVYWHNRDTGRHGSGVSHGINGWIDGSALWEVDPGLTDVEVYLTQAPGVLPVQPGDLGPIRSHMTSGAFAVTVPDCREQW